MRRRLIRVKNSIARPTRTPPQSPPVTPPPGDPRTQHLPPPVSDDASSPANRLREGSLYSRSLERPDRLEQATSGRQCAVDHHLRARDEASSPLCALALGSCAGAARRQVVRRWEERLGQYDDGRGRRNRNGWRKTLHGAVCVPVRL